MSELALDIHDVVKRYKRDVLALRGITMRVEAGSVFGLLGPNGAGKSTLVKILMTVIKPTQCEGTLLGNAVGHKATLARVGYLPEHHKFPDYLKGAQVLDYYGALAGMSRADRKRRTGELLEIVGMSDWANARTGGYSKGMRQRLGIANAMIADPDLVILDEPTDGVDPVGRRDIRNVLAHLKEQGKTVFLNSHLLSELEMVCDRVAILVQGEVAQQGTIEELTADENAFVIRVAPGPGAEQTLAGIVDRLTQVDGQTRRLASGAEVTGGERFVRIRTEDPAEATPILKEILDRGLVIARASQQKPSLEDLFMRAVTDPTTGEAKKPGASMTGKGDDA